MTPSVEQYLPPPTGFIQTVPAMPMEDIYIQQCSPPPPGFGIIPQYVPQQVLYASQYPENTVYTGQCRPRPRMTPTTTGFASSLPSPPGFSYPVVMQQHPRPQKFGCAHGYSPSDSSQSRANPSASYWRSPAAVFPALHSPSASNCETSTTSHSQYENILKSDDTFRQPENANEAAPGNNVSIGKATGHFAAAGTCEQSSNSFVQGEIHANHRIPHGGHLHIGHQSSAESGKTLFGMAMEKPTQPGAREEDNTSNDPPDAAADLPAAPLALPETTVSPRYFSAESSLGGGLVLGPHSYTNLSLSDAQEGTVWAVYGGVNQCPIPSGAHEDGLPGVGFSRQNGQSPYLYFTSYGRLNGVAVDICPESGSYSGTCTCGSTCPEADGKTVTLLEDVFKDVTVGQLPKQQTTVALISYASTATILANSTAYRNYNELQRGLNSIQAGGDAYAGLAAALTAARQILGSQYRNFTRQMVVILIASAYTQGQPDPTDLAEQLFEEGAVIITIAVLSADLYARDAPRISKLASPWLNFVLSRDSERLSPNIIDDIRRALCEGNKLH
ncbi:hypothetical protein AAVH_22706 [Aphelenchoides avenae]|nr:hypothetical protein AAVH_22706 [Aphelenchus avenae]